MNVYVVIPLAALTANIFLFMVILRAKRTRTRPLLLVYLASSAAWAISSFILHANYFPAYSSLLGKLLPLAGLWVVVTYCQLICLFTRRRVITWLVLGYAFITGLVTLFALDYVRQSDMFYGPRQYLLIAGVAWFAVLPMIYLLQGYRTLPRPESRNMFIYLMIGASLAAVLSVRIVIPSMSEYPMEHVGHLGNALLITYILNRRGLPDFKFVAKKGLVYFSSSLLIAPLYLLALWSLHYFSRSWTAPASVATLSGMAFVLPWLLMALRMPVQRNIDRILYGERLAYRQMVLSFPRRMGNVLSLEQLAEGMLQGIPKALNSQHVSLLLASNGDFTSQFTNQRIGVKAAGTIRLSSAGPIVNWLADNDKPLFREFMDEAPEFGGLCDEERNAIQAMNIGLLVPMNSQGRLVGILAVGEKRLRGSYSSDDIDLLTKLGSESAAAIANAQLYAQTKTKIHTDELTGLLSHGYFHRRIDEEVSRCSRFGNVFSVIFLDIDLFKSYNDAFGHLAGDDILRQMGQYIKESIRGIDIPFRYGGDEFAVMLPESSLDDAGNVAERIRRRIESEMDSRGIALTCSIGIAAWPTDGVTREKVLQAVDRALYCSKQKGRNQISLASEVDPSQANVSETNGEQEILSAVHALAATVDAKDANTYGHSKKASEYAVYIANSLDYPGDRMTAIKAAALLHDIGKIRVPDRILVKPGPLNDDEWLAIREHPKFGVAILKHIKGLSGCLPTIQHHHERFDGSGYPAGLAASDIPCDARILAVADAYDAMTSSRPYRHNRLSHQQAIDELARCAGSHFDPEIVRAFAALWEPLDVHVRDGGASRLAKRSVTSSADTLKRLVYTPRARKRTGESAPDILHL